jgi:hypothetical protein
MLSDSVAQKPIIAVSEGANTGRNSDSVLNLPGCDSSGPKPCAAFTAQTRSAQRHDQHVGRGPVLDLPQQIHAAVDDPDVDAPEDQE